MPRPPQPSTNCQNDEIGLLEIWQILARRKAVFIISVLISVAAGIAFAFLTPPVYEASIKLRIGQIALTSGAGLLEPAEVLSSRALAQYGETVADGVKRERPFLKRAKPEQGVTSTVELIAEGNKPEEVAELLARVVADLQATHDATFQGNLMVLNERMANLDVQRIALQDQLREAGKLLERLREHDAVQASLVVLELSRVSSSIGELDTEKATLSQRLLPPQTRRTELIGEIVAPAEPASPQGLLIVAASLAIGLMGGIMLAFLGEFVANARKTGAGGLT